MRGPIDLRASLDQLARGGLPLRARERLADEAGPNRKLFTSDLSVNEHVLVRSAACEPISQVMGSSIYQVGSVPDFKGRSGELEVISNAHRESRALALYRLAQEAALVGADAVVGVHLRDRMITMGTRGKGGDAGGEVLEFTVVGTAVRAPWIRHHPGQPVLTDLSGQDVWALHADGFEPCGFLFEFCRYHVFHVTDGWNRGGELSSASRAVDTARAIASNKVLAQAAQQGAEFVVGSDVTVRVHEVPCGYGDCELDDLDVDVSWFGTGVRRLRGAERHDPPPLVLSMMPLGRRRGPVIEAEDDTEEIRRSAEDAEEAALEWSEYSGQ